MSMVSFLIGFASGIAFILIVVFFITRKMLKNIYEEIMENYLFNCEDHFDSIMEMDGDGKHIIEFPKF